MYDKMTAGPASSRAATPAAGNAAREYASAVGSAAVHHAGLGSCRSRRACEHEDPCADDASDTQQHEVESAENLRRAGSLGCFPGRRRAGAAAGPRLFHAARLGGSRHGVINVLPAHRVGAEAQRVRVKRRAPRPHARARRSCRGCSTLLLGVPEEGSAAAAQGEAIGMARCAPPAGGAPGARIARARGRGAPSLTPPPKLISPKMLAAISGTAVVSKQAVAAKSVERTVVAATKPKAKAPVKKAAAAVRAPLSSAACEGGCVRRGGWNTRPDARCARFAPPPCRTRPRTSG